MAHTRDLTDREFKAALERNGFKTVVGGMYYRDLKTPHIHVGAIYRRNPFRLARRATLAKLLNARDTREATESAQGPRP